MTQEILVEELSKTYGTGSDSLLVFEDLNFEVEEGEFVSIVGPSGCGKSTLLKILAGITDSTGGRVLIDGAEVTQPTDDAAMVFQSFQLLPWKSVWKNVALGLKIQGVSKDKRKEVAHEWLERTGLADFADSYPRDLSGGMKQRVGLARALAVDPEILLMDEPFGALDAQTKDQLQMELLQLWSEKRQTVVFITHDINEAIYLSDRVMVMTPKPAAITRTIDINFDRPRWEWRVELESETRFKEIRKEIRSELGLVV